MIGWWRNKGEHSATATTRRAQFERLTQQHARALLGAARRMTQNTDDAHDLAQETLVRAYAAFDSFAPGSNFRAWLLRILTNNYIMHYRRRQRLSFLAWEDLGESSREGANDFPDEADQEPQNVLFANAMNEEVEAALNRLSEPVRLTLLLVDVEQLSYEEAAVALELPIGTVRSRLNRGREQMRASLAEYARSHHFV